MLQKLTENIFYIEKCDEPLSSDVAVVFGKEYVWVFDTGNCEDALNDLCAITGKKRIVISHFHKDHMGNLKSLDYDALYVGNYTQKYLGDGTVIEEDVYLEDGDVKIHIFALPSSHAKGCLGIVVNDTYAFLGDGICPTVKDGKTVFNVSLLHDEIEKLKTVKAIYFINSHNMTEMKPKEKIISYLEYVYAKKKPGEPYIEVKFWTNDATRNDIE